MTATRSNAEVRILPDAGAIARRAAEKVVEVAADAVRRKGTFEFVLSGGSTPKALYTLLVNDPKVRAQVPWDKMHVFFGDERHVKPDDPQSNYRMAVETLISKSPLKPEQVSRVKAELPEAENAAKDYEHEIRTRFKLTDGQ
ncbi:MAG: 6-phosphogluconolactonase, partial [Candidatus Acidiferrum sp.]